MEKGRHGHAHRAHHLDHLHLHEAAHHLHVRGAALDEIARLGRGIIAVRHVLQMAEQPVAQLFGHRLAHEGHAVPAQVRRRGVAKAHGEHGCAHQPQALLQPGAPAQRLEQAQQRRGQGRRFFTDDAVHREADDERRQVGRDGAGHSGQHAQRQPPLDPAQHIAQQSGAKAFGDARFQRVFLLAHSLLTKPEYRQQGAGPQGPPEVVLKMGKQDEKHPPGPAANGGDVICAAAAAAGA